MLTMKRLQGKEKEALLKELGITRPEVFIYGGYERGTRTGYAVFERIEGKVTLTHAVYGADLDLLDGLVRTGMAWMDDNGLQTLYFSDKLGREPLEKLYFISAESNYVNSVGDFLKTCKKCRM